jgi:protein SCO1/2
MKVQQNISNVAQLLVNVSLLARKNAGALAAGMFFSLVVSPCFAETMPEHDHAMSMEMGGMEMNHSEHGHAMDHSAHEHMMHAKPGVHAKATGEYQIPDVKLVDMNGAKVALHDVLNNDSPIMLNFIFTTCTTICPVMSATFQQVQQQLGPKRADARLISISIDPENDTPAKLKEYAAKYSVGSQWKLLTGSLEDSIAVQRAFGVYAGDKMNHKPVTFLKAKGSDNSWLRLDGLVEAREIVKEFDKNNKSAKH